MNPMDRGAVVGVFSNGVRHLEILGVFARDQRTPHEAAREWPREWL